MPTFTLAELAVRLAARLDDPTEAQSALCITGVNTLSDATSGDLTFLANPKYTHLVATTEASCVLVPLDFTPSAPVKSTLLRVAQPQAAFAQVVRLFSPDYTPEAGFRHPTAVIHQSAQIDPTAYIGAHVSIGKHCILHAGVVLHTGVVLYDDVQIGGYSTLHAHVVCYYGTRIGERCIIHAGTVLGADGFGFTEDSEGRFEKIPQIGHVVVGNDVEIGANCTIDRAALGTTTIGDGVKLDNLVHIAHNVQIGAHTAIAAQTGVSGSTKLGARNRVAGQVGFVGHISTVDDVVVFAQSGVSKSLERKGIYFGYPARPHRESLRIEAALRSLPELVRDVERLKEIVHQLRSSQAEPSDAPEEG
jgi:UDP-3-O-[3-hydroxymyristoyl] glucosamine N-acyltransferase